MRALPECVDTSIGTTTIKKKEGGMTENELRTELANFLRIRRRQLSLAEVGLPSTARRKTAGLRREEVAHLAGVGVTWYTWLEQGRDIHVSAQVLESLAHTFKLSPVEKAHLFLLAGQAPPVHAVPQQEDVSPLLFRLLEHMGNYPAYVTGRRWDVLAWNNAACHVFANFAIMPVVERNIVRLLFTNEEYRHRCVNWEYVARRVLAQLRASYSQYHNDVQLNTLITELQQRSPEFAMWWPQHEVLERQDGRKEFLHPQVGSLVFEHSTLQVEDAPGLRMVVYLPMCEETTKKLEQLAIP